MTSLFENRMSSISEDRVTYIFRKVFFCVTKLKVECFLLVKMMVNAFRQGV